MLKIGIGDTVKLGLPPDFTSNINTDEMKQPVVDFLAKESTLSKSLVGNLVTVDRRQKDNKTTYTISLSGRPIPIEYFELATFGASLTALGFKLPKYVKIFNKGIEAQNTFVNKKVQGAIFNATGGRGLGFPPEVIGKIRGRVMQREAYPILKLWGTPLAQIAIAIGIDIVAHYAVEYIKSKLEDEIKNFLEK